MTDHIESTDPADGKIFAFQEFASAKDSPTPRCQTKAKLEAGKVPMQGVMVRLPLTLRSRLEEQTAGSMSVTICALVEYALDQLEKEGKAIVVANREK
ncbi:MAG: hypothetical protein ACXWJK_15080 [Burkholderiaceae bacterium]